MSARIEVAGLDGCAERDDHALGPLELVEQCLHPQERADPRAQLRELERLAEEIVGAGGQPGHPRVEIGHGGEDHDRGQREARIGLEPLAQLDAADPLHVNVREDQIRRGHLDVAQRRLGRRGHAHGVAELDELIPEHLAHVELVLDDENRGVQGHRCPRPA